MTEVASVAASRTPRPENATTGKPFDDLDDGRKEFQESELQGLWNLTGEYTDALLDDDKPWRIDTDLLSPPLLEQSEHPAIILAEMVHILRTRQVMATFDDLHALRESGVLLPSTWTSTTYGYELASQIATCTRALVENALGHMSNTDKYDMTTEQFVRLPRRISGTRELQLLPNGRLVTAPFLWEDGGDQLLNSALGSNKGLEVMMLATPDNIGDIMEKVDEI